MADTLIIDVNSSLKEDVIEIRKSFGLKMPDSIVAGTALNLQIPLISADKEFKKVSSIELLYFEK